MTEKWPNGGYAFPAEYRHDGEPWVNPGMTLRDWFAGQVLSGIMANPEESRSICKVSLDESIGLTVEIAYRLADAMLEARNK